MKKCFKATLSLLLSVTVLTTGFMGLKATSAATLSAEEEAYYTCFTDDFNRETISGENSGWIEGRQTTANLISDGTLHLKDTSSEMIRGYAHDLVMRPMTEAALNQEASVEINNLAQLPESNASANLHLRLVSTELMTVGGGSYPWYGESYYARVSSTKLQLHKTYARDTNKDMTSALLQDGSGNNAVAEYNAVDGSHTFALVFTVKDSYPTTLTATLYDLTNSVVVASVQAVDSTPSLQGIGTAAISMCGGGTGLNKTAKLDNFEYRRTDSGLIYYDDFSKTDITKEETSGGWIEQVEAAGGTSSNVMGNIGTETKYTGMLRIVDGTGNGHTKNLVVRPMSEASVDQKVSVTVANLGHIGYGGSSANVHARVTSPDAANTASYFVSLGLKAFSVSKADGAGKVTPLAEKAYDSNLSDQPYRVELEAVGTYPTTLTARFYRISDNAVIDELTCTDYTVELQRSGTAGLSVTKSSSSSERKGAFDGFLYEHPNASFYFDDFGRKNITVSDQNAPTGWIEQMGADTKNYIGTGAQDHNGKTFPQGTLIITGTGTAVGYKRNLVMRPMSEAAVNQKAEVTIFSLGDHFVSSQAGASANLHLRVTATDTKYATSYFASAQDGYLRICKMVSPDGETDAKLQEIKKVALDLGSRVYRLTLEATGVYPTTLTARLYNVTDDTLVTEISATDSEPALQRKGTAGLSVTNNNGTTQQRFGQFDNFLYQSKGYNPDEIDLDGDGNSNDGDIATLRKLLIGSESSDGILSDINADGNTDICDLVFAQRILLHKGWDRDGYIVVGGGYDSEAATMRSSIVNSVSASPQVSGTTYYISPSGSDWNSGTSPDKPWKNLKYDFLFWGHDLQEGDAVLFERGGVYRQTETLNVDVGGIYFGAYGEGAKPVICGSAQDYTTANWASGGDNIWTLSGALTSSDTAMDAGIIVFDNGQWAGRLRSSSADLKKNGDFYHDTENDILYLYCDGGKPSEAYSNIEIGVDRHIFGVFNDRDGITFDNLCFRYTGGHGITLYQNNDNIKITNCEFGWIGGSIHTGTTRYGNAIQFWDSCGNVIVENNWIYQVYDAGFTFQFSDHGEGRTGGRYENIKFLGNLVEYCTYSVELFSESTDACVKNVTISDNVMRFAGYGWGNQRPSKEDDSHINGWSGNVDYDAEIVTDFVITNNVFDCSTTQIINWRSSTPLTGVTVSSNTYFEKAYGNNLTMNYSTSDKTYADNQTALEEAVAVFDPSPSLVKWLKP